MGSSRDQLSLDDVDLDLVAALQISPRAGHKLLAEAVGVSEPTISRRLARLRHNGTLVFTIQMPWWVRSETHPHHVWITTRAGTASSTAAAVAALPQAQYVAVTAGQADVYAILHCSRRSEVGPLLTKTLPSIEGVVATHAELALEPFATAAGWRLHRLEQAAETRLNECAGGPIVPAVVRGVLTDEEQQAIRILQTDGRSTAADLRRHLGLSGSTAYRLLQSLLERGVAVPRVEVEPELLGFPIEVVVPLVAKPGSMSELASTLAKHPSARSVSTIAGRNSVIHHGVFADEADLSQFLSHELAALPGVAALEVSIVLQVLNRYWGRRQGVDGGE